MQKNFIRIVGIVCILIGALFVIKDHKKMPPPVDGDLPQSEILGQLSQEPTTTSSGSETATPATSSEGVQSEAFKFLEQKRATTKPTPPSTEAKQKAEKIRAEVNALSPTQKKQKALEKLKEAYEEAPTDPKVLAELAETNLILNHLSEARHYALECLTQDPENEDCKRILGESIYLSGNLNEYLLFLQDCLREKPKSLYCLTGLVNYHFDRKQLAKGYEVILRLQQYYPNSKELFLLLGDYHYKKQELDKALNNYRVACKLKSNYACRQVGALRVSD